MLAEKDLDLVLIAPPDHWHALIMIEAAKSGVDIWVQKPISRDVLEGIEQGYISTASCILANNSMKLGRSLAWDPEKQLVVGDSEANALLRQEYRAPYTHPEA